MSEHEPYDPFRPLEIMTATSAGMDGYAIFRTLEDLKRLAHIVNVSLSTSMSGRLERAR